MDFDKRIEELQELNRICVNGLDKLTSKEGKAVIMMRISEISGFIAECEHWKNVFKNQEEALHKQVVRKRPFVSFNWWQLILFLIANNILMAILNGIYKGMFF